eukprot:TRINITY_DN8124_c0_g1_i2.p1 TRINITY_DN8124_c0_g1~~TRINITY_DN8124_c0_g1_i2.p1  ORF type:complete len:112 (+),score=15.83 TRINITY_DN8124_c0_g1_i2:76-411(+)
MTKHPVEDVEEEGRHGTHISHEGHEEMHSMLLLLLMATLLLAQLGLFYWKKKHSHSYQIITLLGLWLVPIYMSLSLYFWRMVIIWTIFSAFTLIVFYRAQQKPLMTSTPRY